MSFQWKSLNELQVEFSLETTLDRPATKRALINQLSQIHPDKFGGTFPDTKTEASFARIQSALKYLGSPEEQLPALFRQKELELAEKNLKLLKENSLAEKLKGLSQEARRTCSARMNRTRINSGALFSISAFIFNTPESIEKLDILTNSDINLLVKSCFILAIYFGVCFVLTWRMEHFEDEFVESLLTDNFTHEVLIHFQKENELSKDQICDLINSRYQSQIRKDPIVLLITLALLQRRDSILRPSITKKIGALHIEKLLDRNLISEYRDDPAKWDNYKIV